MIFNSYLIPLFIFLSGTPVSKTETILFEDPPSPIKEKSLPPLSENELESLKKLGGTKTADGNINLHGIIIDRQNKEIIFPGKTGIRHGMLEVLIAYCKGRTHESLIETEIDPLNLQIALYLLGGQNGSRKGEKGVQQGNFFKIEIQPEDGGRRPIEQWLHLDQQKSHVSPRHWVFVGSSFSGQKCMATIDGNLCLLWSSQQTILDNPEIDGDEDDHFQAYLPYMVPEKDANQNVKIFIFPESATTKYPSSFEVSPILK